MKTIQLILDEIQGVMTNVDEHSLEKLAAFLAKGKRIFVIGEGRSGLMAKSFAMRLMHLGANAFVVGETTTPSIEAEDILVAVSGSGKTKSAVWTAEKASSLGCEVVAITTAPNSELALHASFVVNVPAVTKYRTNDDVESIQPLGSLFDQSVHIILDVVCYLYSKITQADEDETFNRHSNLE
ncbi:6-phospho 3-hexuloisomerase [Robertmurraya siralis]|uniref:6-phospho 3-hexuloisomerase n=1 Tax=Robertmurraya siralis TaxID=77777 RepID=A0A919WKF8_9BACI|nr:6-phospho-3-hexuloisomerase [Robertmurraya siralis]PAE21246.1 6-phospho-3-hexuloisomerase [Bacillus sp. 7504-2]GIN63610.1 6-phospho 3-hexuloisomerase [Robertmurraya siralis]